MRDCLLGQDRLGICYRDFTAFEKNSTLAHVAALDITDPVEKAAAFKDMFKECCPMEELSLIMNPPAN